MPGDSNENMRTRIKWHRKLFDRSVIRQTRLRRLENYLGHTAGMTCLAIGGDVVVHERLRARGGDWRSAAWDQESVSSLKELGLGDVILLAGSTLPCENAQFDRIVVLGGLEQLSDDHGFIEEVHRALKNTGMMILQTSHAKRWGVVPSLKRFLDMNGGTKGWVRPGYTESQLFEILKDGFDVQALQTFSRFFVEIVDMMLQYVGGFFLGAEAAGETEKSVVSEQTYAKAYRYFSIVYPIAWVASGIDALLFFARGYSLIAKAKRRIWKPRTIPVLADGRSLAEATLRTKIGTAVQF